MCKITTPFPSHNNAIIRRKSAATAELTGFVDADGEDSLLSSFVSTTLENLQKVECASHALHRRKMLIKTIGVVCSFPIQISYLTIPFKYF